MTLEKTSSFRQGFVADYLAVRSPYRMSTRSSHDMKDVEGMDQQETPAYVQALLQRIATLERSVAQTTQNPKDQETTVSGDMAPDVTEGNAASVQTNETKRLPHPPTFEGVKSNFKPWLSQVYAKLSVDMCNSPGSVRFWYVHSRLGATPLAQVTPWVQARVSVNKSLDEVALDQLIQQLRNAYDDPESQERAMRSLQTLKQNGKSFSSYLAKFERLLLEAGGLEWDEAVKKAMLSNGLSLDIQKTLAATPTPPTYDAYISLIHTVAHNLDSIKLQEKGARSRPVPTTAGEPMDWESSRTVTVASQSRARRAVWVSKEVLEERKAQGSCLRCGNGGHFSKQCELLPARRPVAVSRVTTNCKSDVKSEGSESESEKEEL